MAYHYGGPSVQGQLLEMTVMECYKLSDKEWFSKQDPYVVIEYSGQKFRTRTDTDGGKNPSFNETFKFALIDGLREMSASVWNSNMIERDDYIGTTKNSLHRQPLQRRDTMGSLLHLIVNQLQLTDQLTILRNNPPWLIHLQDTVLPRR